MNNERLNNFMDNTERDLTEIKQKVGKLWDFRSLLIGGAAAVSAIVSLVISLAAIYFSLR